MKPKNSICLWFDKDAHDAARFLAALRGNSFGLGAVDWTAAGTRRRFSCADETADEPYVNLFGQGIDVQSFAGDKGFGVIDTVDARRLDVDFLESRLRECGDVLV